MQRLSNATVLCNGSELEQIAETEQMKWNGFPTIQYVTNLRRISRNSTSLTALSVMHGTMRKITAAKDYEKHEACFAATTMKYYSTTASSQPKVYYCLSPNLLVGFNRMQNNKSFNHLSIMGWAVALICHISHSAKYRKWQISTQNTEPIMNVCQLIFIKLVITYVRKHVF